jgi:hypothetical protein
LIIKRTITSLFRVFAAKRRVFNDGTIAHTTIGGVPSLEFLLNVMCPAAVIRLIQQDEERQHSRVVSFEEAFEIAVASSAWGDLSYPDPDEQAPTLTEDELIDILEHDTEHP